MKQSVIILVMTALLAIVGCGGSNESSKTRTIVIYYMGWDILTRISLTCQDVVVQGDSVEISVDSVVTRFESALNSVKLEENSDYLYVNARICIVFRDQNDIDIKTISVGRFAIEIGGIIFEPDRNFYQLLKAYLPKGYFDLYDPSISG